jgi:hypothetical protein
MNAKIRQYFDAIEVRLIESSAIASYQIIRRDISIMVGKMRIKTVLSNDEAFEFFIYMVESNEQLVLEKYSFHWQDKDGALLIRMDNAPHFPNMPNAPHHVHKGKEVVEALLETPELLSFLDEIEKMMI